MDPESEWPDPYTPEQRDRAADRNIPDEELTEDELDLRYGGHPPPCDDEGCPCCRAIAFDTHSENWTAAEEAGIVGPDDYDVLSDTCPGVSCPYCGGVEPGKGVR